MKYEVENTNWKVHFFSTFFILCVLLSVLPTQSKAQGFDVWHELQGDSVVYFASNANFCPYYVEMHPLVDTAEFDKPHTFLLEAQTKKKRVKSCLKPTQVGKISNSSKAYLGNPYLRPDSSHIYTLPFAPNLRFKIIQGYNGRFSHKKQYALDFKMPEGTPIHAARGGVVIKVKQDSNKSGRTIKFAEHGNFIVIYHEDGTLAYYYHLQQNGSKVKVGEQVTQGQFIALSGNTGWSTTPHLHFIVKFTKIDGYGSLPTWFSTAKKAKTRLKAWKRYSR
jgi:murein DD-endopeptidase MepM/ murein hydrolase activator NlpD